MSDVTVDGVSAGAVTVHTVNGITTNITVSASFVYKAGAETVIDAEGIVTEFYTETVSGTTVEIEKTSAYNNSVRTSASVVDGNVRVYSICVTDADGKTEGSTDAMVTSASGTAKLSADDIQSTISSAGATAEAAGFGFSSVNLILVPIAPKQTDSVYAEIDLSSYTSGLGTVTLDGDAGSLALDGDTVSGLAGKSVKMGIGRADMSAMTDEQKSIALKYDVLDIGAESGTEVIHDLAGKATVKVPYSLKDGEDASDVKLYYLDDQGNVASVDGTYADGFLTADLEHLSYYFASGSYDKGSGGYDESTVRLNMASAVAMFILAAGIIVAFVRRR